MLGLGVSLVSGGAPGEWTPESISNLQLWLKVNQNITSDQDNTGSSHSHSTAAGNMGDRDKINAWNAFGSTSLNLAQTTQTYKPLWETDAADVGAVYFSGSKVMEISSDIVFDENTDFTIAMRFRAVGLSGSSYNKPFMGSADTEFIRISDNTSLRMKIDNTIRDFTLASGTIATDEYFTLIVVRSDGSTGNLNMFIRGNESLDGTATGTQIGSELQDTGEITLEAIGGVEDDVGQSNMFIKDLLIWDGTAASSGDRKEIFDYIEGQ
tara:strand:- start:228 stop:1028 length:801 start_codon:yes stop_codon:yes gene_type:complete